MLLCHISKVVYHNCVDSRTVTIDVMSYLQGSSVYLCVGVGVLGSVYLHNKGGCY